MSGSDDPHGWQPDNVESDQYVVARGSTDRLQSRDKGIDSASSERQTLDEIIRSAEREESQRFSLWGLFGLVTVAAIILGVGAYLPKAVFAGVLGIATLLAMVVLSLLKLPAAILQVGWWMMLVIYLIAIVSAIRGS